MNPSWARRILLEQVYYTSVHDTRGPLMSRNGQKKNRRTETQHYVPQFYLRRFVNESGRMFCYDKVSDRSCPTSTTAAAQEPYFI